VTSGGVVTSGEEAIRKTWRPRTLHHSFYDTLKTIKAFSFDMHIFPVAVVIGFLLGRERTETDTGDSGNILEIGSLFAPEQWPEPDWFKFSKEIVFDLIWTHHLVGKNRTEKQNALEKMADGGIEYLMEMHRRYGKIDSSMIVKEMQDKFGQETPEPGRKAVLKSEIAEMEKKLQDLRE